MTFNSQEIIQAVRVEFEHLFDFVAGEQAHMVKADSIEPGLFKRLKLIWADGSYHGALIAWVEERFGWKLEVVEKSKQQIGFPVLPSAGLWNAPLPGSLASVA